MYVANSTRLRRLCMRSMAWLLALACCHAGCNAPEVSEPALEQQIAAVRAGKTTTIQIETQALRDADLAELTGLENLEVLLLDHSDGRFTSAGIRHLAGLPALEHLRIRGMGVDDEALAQLSQLKRLRILNIPQGAFGNAALVALKELPDLEQLRFGSPRVNDAGMLTIAELPALKRLHLINVPITDEGLRTLSEIEQLESLYIDGAFLSDEALETLFRERPKLHVHLNQQHHDRDPHKHVHTSGD